MNLLSDTYSYYFDNSITFQVVLFYMCPEKHDNKLKTLLTLSQIDERLFNTSKKKKKSNLFIGIRTGYRTGCKQYLK